MQNNNNQCLSQQERRTQQVITQYKLHMQVYQTYITSAVLVDV